MITAFFHQWRPLHWSADDRATRGQSRTRTDLVRGRQVSRMAAGEPVAGSSVMRLMENSAPATLPAAAVAASHAGGSGSAAGRIALVIIAVAAVGAFTVLQLMARSRRRRSRDLSDWRTFPPRYEGETGDSARPGDDDALIGNQESNGPHWGDWSPP